MEQEQVFGTIENVVFSNSENGFTVARVKVPKEQDLVSIVGTMPPLSVGENISCMGTWKRHPQFGRQLQVTSFSLEAPGDLTGMERYLASGMIKGIGPAFAKRIVDYFGEETFSIFDGSPDKLGEVPGIGAKKLEQIVASWHAQKEIRNLMLFLQSKQIRCSFAQKIYRVYGDNSIKKIQENPYALAKSVFGIGFKTADELAAHLGISKDAPARIQAGVEFGLWELASDGNTCIPRETLTQYVTNYLEVGEELIDAAIEALEATGDIVINPIDSTSFVWIKPLYMSETGIAREIARLQELPSHLRTVDIEKALDWVEEQMKITLAKEQKEAVTLCMQKKMHIITGGPGTGKSTITKAILSITKKLTSKILLAAPTGRAAKRMQEITRHKASTIHSLLEYDFSGSGFKKGPKSPLSCDLIIVDEASMIDTQLMYSLLKAIPDSARVLLIGDIDQLPSVGPGTVLKDIIESEKVSATLLKEIFRQAKGSKIVTNAHRVNHGYMPDLSSNKGDFLYIEGNTPEEILERVTTLVTKDIIEKFSFDPFSDIQVLAPMKRGVIGTENINIQLQKLLNPQGAPLQRMGREFRCGDKVMQLKNNYDKNVYNGDVGRITHIDKEDQELLVDFDGAEVIYEFSELDELMLAYAVSIHKYQGSECPCIIIPIHTTHFKLLFRNLLYTGITRGRKLVVLVGSKKAIAIAAKNDNVKKRFTGLQHIIKQFI